jgi:hypothetical protein
MANHPSTRSRHGQGHQAESVSEIIAEAEAEAEKVAPDPTQGDAATTQDPSAESSGTPGAPSTQDVTASSETETEKRKYTRKDPIKDIPADELGEAEDVPESEWETTPLTASATAKPRSDAQQKIDADFKSLLDKWTAAGKPEPRKSPRSRRVISREYAPALRFMISGAATLYEVAVKFAPAAYSADGREVIVYSPVEKIRRPRKAAAQSAEQDKASAGLDTTSPGSGGDGSLPGETA